MRYGEGVHAITKGWHRFEPLDQYGYLEALDAIAGSRVGVGEWEEMCAVLRRGGVGWGVGEGW